MYIQLGKPYQVEAKTGPIIVTAVEWGREPGEVIVKARNNRKFPVPHNRFKRAIA